jgi:hypothetical protein
MVSHIIRHRQESIRTVLEMLETAKPVPNTVESSRIQIPFKFHTSFMILCDVM